MSGYFSRKVFDPATKPMFDEHVVIEAVRPTDVIRGTFRACVFVNGYGDPLSEGALESDVKTATILVAKYGPDCWSRPDDPPRKGDIVTLETGVSFAVTERDELVSDHYHLEARQVD